jgi:hypothetical protein
VDLSLRGCIKELWIELPRDKGRGHEIRCSAIKETTDEYRLKWVRTRTEVAGDRKE